MTKKQKKTTTDAVTILYNRYVKDRPEMEALYNEELENLVIGQQIQKLRSDAGLTQQQLAEIVGTTPSAICRLESAEYEGHSLKMLKKVASALKQRVEIRLVPAKTR